MSIILFKDMEINGVYDTKVIVSTIAEKSTANGKPMLRIMISDGTESVSAVMFDTTKKNLNDAGVCDGMAAETKIHIDSFGGRSYQIQYLRPTTLDDSEKSALVRKPPVEPDKLFVNVIQKIKASSGRDYDLKSAEIKDGDYSLTALAVRLLMKDYKAFYSSSAAKSMHHNLYGGLVYHTSRMVDAAFAICDVYTMLDRELLVCGAAIHDLGKLKELKTSDTGVASYTTEGSLLGHALLGIEMIDEEVAARDAAAGRQTYDRDDIMCIKHLIASHHGKLEWEAIKLPAMPEAMMLHELDMIDSRIYIYEETLSKTEPGTLSEPVYGIAADKTSTPLYRRINGTS